MLLIVLSGATVQGKETVSGNSSVVSLTTGKAQGQVLKCCKLAQVDVRKWLNHFFTHIHEYDNDYSRDLMELLPHNLKQKGTLWHPLKILQDSWLIPRILENPTRFWKYLQYFRRNPAIRGLLMAYEKLVSTNYKWKVLKRKKPPKWWLISSYKNVL